MKTTREKIVELGTKIANLEAEIKTLRCDLNEKVEELNNLSLEGACHNIR